MNQGRYPEHKQLRSNRWGLNTLGPSQEVGKFKRRHDCSRMGGSPIDSVHGITKRVIS
jgi:hypothetical protein